ncbi:MAG: zinc-dependent peptidase [Flavobacteriaceae bacterium]|nr:zinc-dependent peptidase [Flavobacteriaceae bacterium]
MQGQLIRFILASGNDVIIGFIVALFLVIAYFGFRMLEMMYVFKRRRPLYIHLYLRLNRLSSAQKLILDDHLSFYKKLNRKQQRYFEHRVYKFIEDKDFIGRQGQPINDEVKVLISATAVMLTFGFRDYFIGLIDTILVYPKSYYSNISDGYHKGEFNPQLRALVLSWEDFNHGYDIENDNLNLGVHEFSHAIHLNSLKERDVSSGIFSDGYKELMHLLSKDEELRLRLITTRYFRDYAYTNQYEFIAAIIESFIENPKDIRSQFPMIYKKVKQMLNFNFAGY